MQFDKTDMGPQLSHLENQQLEQLILRYYESENYAVLIDDYYIDFAPDDLVEMFPLLVVTGNNCYRCLNPLVQRYLTRNKRNVNNLSNSFCKNCQPENKIFNKNKLLDEKQCIANKDNSWLIELCFNTNEQKTNSEFYFNSISIIDAIYLFLLKNYAIKYTGDTVYELAKSPEMMPFNDFSLFESLIKNKLISLISKPPSDAICICDGEVVEFKPFQATWKVHYPDGFEKINLIDKSKFFSECIIKKNEPIKDTWMFVALCDCIEYFSMITQDLGFILSVNDKVVKMISKLLHYYSVSECCRILWECCHLSIRNFQNELDCDQKEICEYTITEFLKLGESLLNDYVHEIYGIRRPTRLIRSVFNKIFFDEFLKLDGDIGFYEVPTEINIP